MGKCKRSELSENPRDLDWARKWAYYILYLLKAQTVKLQTRGGDDDILATKNELSTAVWILN